MSTSSELHREERNLLTSLRNLINFTMNERQQKSVFPNIETRGRIYKYKQSFNIFSRQLFPHHHDTLEKACLLWKVSKE
jgi:hypothetical protein